MSPRKKGEITIVIVGLVSLFYLSLPWNWIVLCVSFILASAIYTWPWGDTGGVYSGIENLVYYYRTPELLDIWNQRKEDLCTYLIDDETKDEVRRRARIVFDIHPHVQKSAALYNFLRDL